MKRTDKARFIAYKFADPLGSPEIKRDTSLVRLLEWLDPRIRPRVFGPAIYMVPQSEGLVLDPRLDCLPVGIWIGGMKIRLFEFVEPPPAPGVEFTKQIEFIERSDDGEAEEGEDVRDDGPSFG